jgi:hypothetical protein
MSGRLSSPPSFLDLPGEIRNQIYAYLLVIPAPSTTLKLGDRYPIYPTILATNSQIHAEALPFLYAHNTFLAHPTLLTGLPQLRRWLDPVKSQKLIGMIRKYHIFVRLECDARFSAEAARDAFSGMDELTIEVFQSQFRGSGNDVLRLFEKIRDVKRRRVFGSVSEWPEYVKWLEWRMGTKPGEEEDVDSEEEGRDGEEMQFRKRSDELAELGQNFNERIASAVGVQAG